MTTDEKKISGLYQQGSKEGPSVQMDNAILKASRDALGKPSSVKSPFSGSWPVVASIAAVLLLTVILVPLVNQETPEILSTDEIQDEQLLLRKLEDDAGRLEAGKAKKRSLAEEPKFNFYEILPEKELPAAVSETVDSAYEEQIVPMRSTAVPASSVPVATPSKQELHQDSIRLMTEKDMKQQRSRMEAAGGAPFAILTPEMWQEKIRQLINQGNLDYAQDELDKFRARYPDEKVDQSILNKLRENHE